MPAVRGGYDCANKGAFKCDKTCLPITTKHINESDIYSNSTTLIFGRISIKRYQWLAQKSPDVDNLIIYHK